MASYEQNPKSKLWSVRFRFTDRGELKNKRLSGFRTKKDAERGYTEYKNSHIEKTDTTEFLTLIKAINYYLSYLEHNAKPSSYVTQKQRIYHHILPYFDENTIVQSLTELDIVEWQNWLSKKGLSFKYKSSLRGVFHAVLEHTKELGMEKNVIDNVRGFKNLEIDPEMSFWTEDEFKKFISVVDDLTYRALFSFLYITGARKGEALALKWKDFDLNKGEVKISKTIGKTKDGLSWIITSPKTKKSNRIVSLTKKLTVLMGELKKQSHPNFYVFGDIKPLPINTLRMRFVKYIKNSGVPYIRIHDLRHSSVSFMINHGKNQLTTIYAIADRIGDNVEQIFKTYGHLFPKQQQTLLEHFESIEV